MRPVEEFSSLFQKKSRDRNAQTTDTNDTLDTLDTNDSLVLNRESLRCLILRHISVLFRRKKVPPKELQLLPIMTRQLNLTPAMLMLKNNRRACPCHPTIARNLISKAPHDLLQYP